MIIKDPPVYDISHWKEVLDFSAINPRPFLCITKATEAAPDTGYNHTDDKFVRFFDGMRRAGIRRGCYHFFRKRVDASRQAQFFVSVIKPHLNDRDVIALDIEEGGETAAQIITFCDYVEAALPKNTLLIYSRKTVLDLIPMSIKQQDRLKQIPTWVAGYPFYPDWFSKVPVGYIPDQNRWGPVWLWQYSEKGEVAGIQGAVDLNWIDPLFQALLGDEPTPEIIEPPTGDNAMYEVISTLYNMSLRPDHNTGAQGTEWVPKNTLMKADQIWTATADLYKLINGVNVKINAVGDKWAHIIEAGGVAKNAWTAVVHLGVVYCTVKEIAAPPTTTDPVKPVFTVTVQAEGYKTATVDLIPE